MKILELSPAPHEVAVARIPAGVSVLVPGHPSVPRAGKAPSPAPPPPVSATWAAWTRPHSVSTGRTTQACGTNWLGAIRLNGYMECTFLYAATLDAAAWLHLQ